MLDVISWPSRGWLLGGQFGRNVADAGETYVFHGSGYGDIQQGEFAGQVSPLRDLIQAIESCWLERQTPLFKRGRTTPTNSSPLAR